MTIDSKNMVFGNYVGDWSMVSFIVTCDCEKAAESQQVLLLRFSRCEPRHQVVHGRFSVEWLFNGVVELHGRDFDSRCQARKDQGRILLKRSITGHSQSLDSHIRVAPSVMSASSGWSTNESAATSINISELGIA